MSDVEEHLPFVACGGAAAILVSEDFAKKNNVDLNVKIISQSMTTDYESTFAENDMMQLVGYDMSREAARNVCEDSAVDIKDIDVVELHDCFATAEMLHYENLGLCKDGEAGKMIDEGHVELGGKVPVNVSGGLLSKGHPLGATGIANIYEICTHLRGEAGKRQVEGAKIGMTHVIGLGTACGIHILEKPS